MRLTLRTLLAYLDDLLEPSEQEEIRRKLQESPVATALAGRIEEVLRGSWSSPDPVESDIDPNILAQYLENTLPPEQVVDVEKLCLASERQLAEVAECHRILSTNFGEPVEMKPSRRDALYRLSPGDERPASAERPTAEGQTAVNDWYCRSAQIGFGPHSFDDLLEFARGGELSPEDSIRWGDQGPWRRADSMGRLMVLMPFRLPASAPTSSPSVPALQPTMSDGVRASTVSTNGIGSVPNRITASAHPRNSEHQPRFEAKSLDAPLKNARVLGALATLAALVLLIVGWDYVGWIFLIEGTGKFRAPCQELLAICSDMEEEVKSNPSDASWKTYCDQTRLRMNSTERVIRGLHSGLEVNSKLLNAISGLKAALGVRKPQDAEGKLHQAQRSLEEAATVLKL